MKSLLSSVLLILTIPLAGIALPKLLFKDAKNISEETTARAKDSSYQYIFDNSIEPWLIMSLVVRDRKSSGKLEIVFVDAYTLFGIKYATVASVHNSQTGALVCVGRAYQIWQKNLANRPLPCG